MKGLLGGLLGILNGVGGLVLAVLIGWDAAQKKNTTGRWARIVIGSIPVGILSAASMVYFTRDWDYWTYGIRQQDWAGLQLMAFPITVVCVAVGALLLEVLKQSIEKQPPTDSK